MRRWRVATRSPTSGDDVAEYLTPPDDGQAGGSGSGGVGSGVPSAREAEHAAAAAGRASRARDHHRTRAAGQGRAGARLRRARGHRGARRAAAAAASGDDVTIDGRADDQPKADRHAVGWDFRKKNINLKSEPVFATFFFVFC